MNVHIQMFRNAPAMRALLVKDGWNVERKQDDSVSASHPEVSDEPKARQRLCDLGLLTSALCRISFDAEGCVARF